jgi:glycerol-3-phosphate dehydrogenase subunit B
MTEATELSCDLAVIGAGLAGFAAALFAANRGLSTVQAGGTGAVSYTTGFFDVLGAIPPTDPDGAIERPEDPFAAIERLLALHPGHPYRLTAPATIRAALAEWTGYLASLGLAYVSGGAHNLETLTPAGTIKRTYCVPATMLAAKSFGRETPPGLLLDFKELKGFSARQIAATLGPLWPNLRTVRLPFPGHPGGELYPENAARALELPEHREELAAAVRPLLGDAACLGLPAVLGMHRPDRVRADLAERLGLHVFEIPTMPPAVPGIRLREALEGALPERGVTLFCQQKMRLIDHDPSGLTFRIYGQPVERTVRARAAILASGRFLAGGLRADLTRISENVFDLPVAQPASRSDWHRLDYFDPRGHPLNRAGIAVDDEFRPLGAGGRPFHPHLHAAGSILAHADWMRMKCGAGVAIATALGAVTACTRGLGLG